MVTTTTPGSVANPRARARCEMHIWASVRRFVQPCRLIDLRHIASAAAKNASISAVGDRGALATAAVAVAVATAVDALRDALVPVTPRVRHTVASADGTRLEVYEYGVADGPAVVLVHGWTCSADFWTPQIRALADEARLIVYDQRGHGRSDMPGPAGYTSDALADDLSAVLGACVPEGGRAVVGGHSMGAMAVIACASRNPEIVRARVHAAVLASTGVNDLVPSAALVNLPRAFDPVFRPLATLMLVAPVPLGRPTPLTNRFIRFLALTGTAPPEQVGFCEQIILGCPRTVRGQFAAAMAKFDLLDAVSALTVPTSVVVGTADRLTPPFQTHAIAAALPNLVEHRELPGIGHMTPIEAADVVTTMIRNMLPGPKVWGVRSTAGSPGAPAREWGPD